MHHGNIMRQIRDAEPGAAPLSIIPFDKIPVLNAHYSCNPGLLTGHIVDHHIKMVKTAWCNAVHRIFLRETRQRRYQIRVCGVILLYLPVEFHGNSTQRGKAQRSTLPALCTSFNPSIGNSGFIKTARILFQALRSFDAPSEMHQGGLLAFSEDEGMMFPVLPGA